MLSEEYKEAVMQRLKEMTTEDFVSAFERIGSQRVLLAEDIESVIEREMERMDLLCSYSKVDVVNTVKAIEIIE